jgi:hypothetical protein
MYHQEIKQKAINLRKNGYSYNYIGKHIPLAKSTLSDWLHDVPFIPNEYTLKTIGNARVASGKYKHQTKVDSLKKARLQAKKDIAILSDRDVMMLGLGIYIGEGSKTFNITRVVNSDPKIIKFSLKWFKISFGIGIKNVGIRLHLYPDNNVKESIKYWSKITGIPEKDFGKSSIDLRTNKKNRNHGKLPHGTAHITVNGLGDKELGVYLHRRIMAWINRVLC